MVRTTDWIDEKSLNNYSVMSRETNSSIEEGPPKTETFLQDLYKVPPEGITFLFIAYSCICATALVGNGLVLWLILGARRMWTVTNIFLVNLAIADIVISLFTIPFHFQAALLQRWDLPVFLCPICPFVQAVSVLVSVLTLTAIALNRYKVVMNPFIIKTSKTSAVLVIVLIWTLSVGLSVPVYLDFRVIYYHNRNRTLITPSCQQTWLSARERFYHTQLLVMSQYFIPLIILTWAYARMICYIWESETSETQRNAMLQKRKRKVTKMMAGIVTLFGFCWLPYQLYNIVEPYYPEVNDYQYINVIWFSFHWLAMSNSCCNPFVYAIYSAYFRSEFDRRTRCFRCSRLSWTFRRGRAHEDEVFELYRL